MPPSTPTPKPVERCETCKFFERVVGYRDGKCLCDPPELLHAIQRPDGTVECQGNVYNLIFKVVPITLWCGQYKKV